MEEWSREQEREAIPPSCRQRIDSPRRCSEHTSVGNLSVRVAHKWSEIERIRTDLGRMGSLANSRPQDPSLVVWLEICGP